MSRPWREFLQREISGLFSYLNWEVDDGVYLVSPISVVAEPLEVDDEDLR